MKKIACMIACIAAFTVVQAQDSTTIKIERIGCVLYQGLIIDASHAEIIIFAVDTLATVGCFWVNHVTGDTDDIVCVDINHWDFGTEKGVLLGLSDIAAMEDSTLGTLRMLLSDAYGFVDSIFRTHGTNVVHKDFFTKPQYLELEVVSLFENGQPRTLEDQYNRIHIYRQVTNVFKHEPFTGQQKLGVLN